MNHRGIIVLAAGLLLAGEARGQGAATADTAARRQAMDKLAFMEGDWVGDAWAVVGRGERLLMQQTEWIRRKVGGQLMLVEGLGRRLVDGAPRDTVFNAVATIDWRPDRGYLMRSHILDGKEGEFSLVLTEDGFTWGHEVPGGRVRYSMRLTPAGEWNERGEFSRDGTQWFPVMEMTLQRRDAVP